MIANRKSRSLTTTIVLLLSAYLFLVWLPLSRLHAWQHKHPRPTPIQNTLILQDTIHLHTATERYPITSYIPLPTSPSSIPKIQHDFPRESRPERKARVKKQKAIKEAFMHSWNGYKEHAWMRDEVSPQTGGYQDSFSGWGATLVDSLDALIIMGLDDELDLALEALNEIDFTTTRSAEVNVFEIIIRYMGGFLAAHDLSNGKHPILLKKAEELGEMIFNAFDTHNRMPQMRWDWSKSAQGEEIEPSERTSLAELGSLTVEFTRLSQLTGNPKYYDAVQRITNELERGQSKSRIPGLWPIYVNAKDLKFDWSQFSLGGSADSMYEYLPKEHILLGAQTDQYRNMYEDAIEAIKKKLLFRAMTKDEDKQILFTSNVRGLKGGALHGVQYVQDHLKCFLGGTVGLASKIFNRTEDLSIARGLTDGCIWAYDSMPTGIMPETLEVSPCKEIEKCPWDEGKWYEDVLGQPIHSREHLERAQQEVELEGFPPGIVGIPDPTYKLRPEAVESIFIMYRITGDKSLQDAAWRMFQSIDKVTRTKYGHSAIEDVRNPLPKMSDKMESFWLAETLKYLYLIFSEPSLVSLDEYVLSTEAHPFKRPS
ncbi:glycosyl hydrolase family 47 protein [Penicillium brasilianum]|uniref:alpha-1,2-Mannosidase n=1 Tax=Penicillium brasilianum TaxID=104259 RepID=A0A1S9RKR0_PENBI|nr:glycosyl hydrolase family 47 protein [Penicillium brasilianum]